ncbi:MAG TPA: alpha/beta fold hydrolase [Planctomycetota bacterium]|nr:alpha/beta fold hydrolase [Planctomycetota bacterium]
MSSSKIAFVLVCIMMIRLHSASAADAFDPVAFWREQVDVPLDVAVVETGETDGIRWQGIVYTSEIYNGEPMRIFAWYAHPAADGKMPAVLSIHGGGGGADLPRAIAFAKAGYACLAYDWHTCNDPERPKWNAGDPLPSEKYTRYGNLRYTDWAGHFCKPGRSNTRFAPTDDGGDWKHPVLYRAIQAGRRGLTWLGQQPDVDPDKLVLEGHSWGSFLAQLLAGIDPRVKATVGSASILGWRARYEQKLEGHVGSLTPAEFAEWEKRYDAAMYAKKITGPILIRCGASDFFGSIDTLPSYWDKIKAPKRLQLLPAANHTFADVETRVQWFDTWLKGAPGFPEIKDAKLKQMKNGAWEVAVKTGGGLEVSDVSVAWTTSPKQWNQRAWAQEGKILWLHSEIGGAYVHLMVQPNGRGFVYRIGDGELTELERFKEVISHLRDYEPAFLEVEPGVPYDRVKDVLVSFDQIGHKLGFLPNQINYGVEGKEVDPNSWKLQFHPSVAGGPLRVFVSAKDRYGRIVSCPPIIKRIKGEAEKETVTEAPVKVVKAATPPGKDDAAWAKAPKIGPLAAGPEVLNAQSAEMQAMWDADALYLRLVVADNTPWQPAVPGAMWFNGDSVQLRLRTDAKCDDPRVPAAQQHVLHLGWYQTDGNPDWGLGVAVDAVRGRDFRGKIDDTSPVKCKVAIDPGAAKPGTTYTLTVAIPWSFIDPQFKPEPGRTFKLALEVNYADLLTNERAGMIDFNHAGEFSRPEAWGTATLE